MVGEGYNVFETASYQMTRINYASSQLPEAIKRAVTIIVQCPSPVGVKHLLPNALDSVSEFTNVCMCVLPYVACMLEGQNVIVADNLTQRCVTVV